MTDIFESCFSFIEERMIAKFKDATPEMTRKLEMLECLMFTFMEHGEDFSLFDKIEADVYRLAGNRNGELAN